MVFMVKPAAKLQLRSRIRNGAVTARKIARLACSTPTEVAPLQEWWMKV